VVTSHCYGCTASYTPNSLNTGCIRTGGVTGSSGYSGGGTGRTPEIKLLDPSAQKDAVEVEFPSELPKSGQSLVIKITIKHPTLSWKDECSIQLTPEDSSEYSRLEQMILQRDKTIKALLKQVQKIQEDKQAIASFSAINKTTYNSEEVVAWTVNLMPLDPMYFEKSNDGAVITIKQAGIYRFDVKLLNNASTICCPYLSVGGKKVMYFFGGGAIYNDATLNYIVEVQANTPIYIGFDQPSHSSFYVHQTPVHHYLCIQRLR